MPNILLTRPRKRSEAFAKEITKCGWTSTIWPLLTIRPFSTGPIEPGNGQSLIFTSVNAVESIPVPIPIHAPVICVGPATAAAARNKGFIAVRDIAGDAHKLVQTLREAPPQRFLHVRGAHTRGDIAAKLTLAGHPTDEAITYEAAASDDAPREIHTAILAEKIDAIALFSPRSAAIFKKLARVEWLSHLRSVTLFAISPAAAEPARDIGFAKVVVVEKPNGPAMRAAICSATNG